MITATDLATVAIMMRNRLSKCCRVSGIHRRQYAMQSDINGVKGLVKTPLDAWIAGKIRLEPGLLTREAINNYQITQLQKTVALAKGKSAHYRKSLATVDPEKLTDFNRFAELPFTYPQDISDDPHGFVCTSQREIERIVSLQSSGTTGEPKRIFFSKEDQELTIDFFDYGMRNLVGPSDRVLILLPWELPGSVGDLLRIALKRMGAVPIPYGPVYNTAEAIKAALNNQANAMVGIPTHVLGMARQQGGEQLYGKIKSILLTTDYVPQAICQAIEQKWDCEVFNHYGMTEMGLGGGVQCSARRDYHMREADLYFEIIDPLTGKHVPEGEPGEIVFTTLTRIGMPLIRYRTGDLSRFVPESCPCGSVLRRMEVVKGRLSGRKKLAGRDFSIIELDEALFSLDGVLNYHCTLSKDEEKETLTIAIINANRDVTDSNAVYHALSQIPAVAEGLAENQLEVFINMDDIQLPVSKGTIKRGITDCR